MPTEADRKFQKELHAGSVALVLLAVIDASGRAMYGYEIARALEGRGGPPLGQGALYPVLRSLERQGLLSSRTGPSEAGPPRRYYRVTVAGRRALEEWGAIWRRTRDFVDGALAGRFEAPGDVA